MPKRCGHEESVLVHGCADCWESAHQATSTAELRRLRAIEAAGRKYVALLRAGAARLDVDSALLDLDVALDAKEPT